MADKKLSILTELATTPAVDDEVYIRDVSELAPAESKRITIANLMAALIAHKATHQNGGGDEISVAALSGLLADDQHIIDAEAVSAMGVKGDANPLNHDIYLDADAVAAMGAKADANPLNHDQAAEWGATEHTAIGDGAPHHAKYLDSEAKAAAVQSGAITNGVTKAPTHDAVFDVKATADAAQTAGEVDADITTHNNVANAHGAVATATASKMVVRDASARAKFAAPAASGDTLIKGARVTTAELPAMTDEKIWKGTGGNVEEVDMPSSSTFTELVGDQNQTFTTEGFEDWDISGYVPAGTKYVSVMMFRPDRSGAQMGCRKNGSALTRTWNIWVAETWATCVPCEVDANRVIECRGDSTAADRCEYSIIGYWS